MKQIVQAEAELRRLAPIARARLYIHRDLLRLKTVFVHDDELLIGTKELEKSGLIVEPIWNDVPLDSEGEAYLAFMASHPDFDMLIRREVAARLVGVQERLGAGRRLVIKAALRPIEVQQQLFDAELLTLHVARPKLSDEELRAELLQYVTDPRVNLPPHASGGTVDVVVREADGSDMDMGSPINDIADSSWLFYEQLSDAQRANRQRLLRAMLDEGFAPLASEWWHFSYGDQRWAQFYDREALYGAADYRKRL